jgi:hypothetical protein
VKKRRNHTWETISERDWRPYIRTGLTAISVRIRRIRIGTPEYDQVVRLRYLGFAESGFIDPMAVDETSMRLERDMEAS